MGTLDMRPMFHFTERRIVAHIRICFVALVIHPFFDEGLSLP